MSKRERTELLNELAAILGVDRSGLPRVLTAQQVKVLKRGVHEDLAQRFPNADASRIAAWLQRYTSTRFYLARTCSKNATNRHDLDGADVEPISAAARYRAIKILRSTPATSEAA